jgi:hypothetical protein
MGFTDSHEIPPGRIWYPNKLSKNCPEDPRRKMYESKFGLAGNHVVGYDTHSSGVLNEVEIIQ